MPTGWNPFNVNVAASPAATAVQDGEMDFTYTLSGTDSNTLDAGAVLVYSSSSADPGDDPQPVFTTAAAITADNDGNFNIGSPAMTGTVTIPPDDDEFTGGTYNTVVNVVFTPPTATESGVISGTFQDISARATDPDCEWSSNTN